MGINSRIIALRWTASHPENNQVPKQELALTLARSPAPKVAGICTNRLFSNSATKKQYAQLKGTIVSNTQESQEQVQQSLNQLGDSLRAMVKEEVAAALSGQASSPESAGANLSPEVLSESLKDAAPELFASMEWKKEFNSLIESAFHTVLPQLIKRFKLEVDQRLKEGGGGSVDVNDLVSSTEFKEHIDEKFRHMVLYIKQDVIPKALA